jgi:4-hydroxyphenylacetate 3-monooxygenase
MQMTVSQSQNAKPVDAPALRTGSEYLRSLRDGWRVYVNGELVKDVTAHPAFREAARSLACLFDLAADTALRERMI